MQRLFELGVRLADGMGHGLDELGLTRARAEVIWRLARLGPITNVALSQVLHVTPRNVTGLVDALEVDGFVARTAHPTDRRATLVTLTDQGLAAAAQMQAGYQELARTLFADLTPVDLAELVETMDQLLERLRPAEPNRSSGKP
ncbi:MAG: MarR family winged helix-turn-helix transcriptional regulator [Acidimicrobiia bacterium]